MRHQFDAFIDDLKRRTAEIGFGHFIRLGGGGDFVRYQSDYNLLIALNEITPKDLRLAQAPMREWNRMGHPAPVYFTVDELESAADVFPIEFHQMERARVVLYGKDVLANLTISDEYLRHQTEYELRSKLIMLRRQYIAASTSVPGLVNLMTESLSSFSALFRAVLIIHGFESPIAKQQVVEATVKQLKLDGKPFDRIFELREKNAAKMLGEAAANALFADYMQQIENVIGVVDKIRKA